ncbi:DNA/RNA nuclease SfsA [Glaciecola sp. SC05]|uniref:DNA/RNA nuclease SfsA n=1 Tax=Glaciecola sp. SC05 TaxID=1987355 RepID=UPI003528E753
MYRFTSALIRGKLIKRYKRFLADVELECGELRTVHCPNTGAMTGCAIPEVTVFLSTSDNRKRKYPNTWEYSCDANGYLIGVNTANANKVVRAALQNKQIPELAHYSNIYPETKHGESRIDFMLQEDGAPDAYIEVKSVTLAEQQTALFPDTITTRGRKHCYELAEIAKQGHKAFLFFCIQRENITQFKIAEKIDPDYAKAIEYAKESGVTILAYCCNMTRLGIEITYPIDIL